MPHVWWQQHCCKLLVIAPAERIYSVVPPEGMWAISGSPDIGSWSRINVEAPVQRKSAGKGSLDELASEIRRDVT